MQPGSMLTIKQLYNFFLFVISVQLVTQVQLQFCKLQTPFWIWCSAATFVYTNQIVTFLDIQSAQYRSFDARWCHLAAEWYYWLWAN